MKRLLSLLLAVAVVASCVFVIPITATASDLFTYTEGGQWSANYADNAAVLGGSTVAGPWNSTNMDVERGNGVTYAYNQDGTATINFDTWRGGVKLAGLDLSKLNLNTDTTGWAEITMDVVPLPITTASGQTYFDNSYTTTGEGDDTVYTYTTKDGSAFVINLYPYTKTNGAETATVPYRSKYNSETEQWEDSYNSANSKESTYFNYFGLLTALKVTDDTQTPREWKTVHHFARNNSTETDGNGNLNITWDFTEGEKIQLKFRVEKKEDGHMEVKNYVYRDGEWNTGAGALTSNIAPGTLTNIGIGTGSSDRPNSNTIRYTLSNAKVTQSVPTTVRLSDLSDKRYSEDDTGTFDFVIPEGVTAAKLTVDGTEVQNFTAAGAYTGSLNLAKLGKNGRVTMTLSGTANGEAFSQSTDFYIAAPAAGSLNEAVFSDLKQGGFYAETVTFKDMEEGATEKQTVDKVTASLTPGGNGSTFKFSELGSTGGSTSGRYIVYNYNRNNASAGSDAAGWSNAQLRDNSGYYQDVIARDKDAGLLLDSYHFDNTTKVVTGQVSSDKVVDFTNTEGKSRGIEFSFGPNWGNHNRWWIDTCGIRWENGNVYVYSPQGSENLGAYTANNKIDLKMVFRYDLNEANPQRADAIYYDMYARIAGTADWTFAGTATKTNADYIATDRDDTTSIETRYALFGMNIKTYGQGTDVDAEGKSALESLPTITADNFTLTETTPTDARIQDLSKGFYTSWDSVPVAFTLPEGYSDAILTVDGTPIAAMDATSNPSGAYTGNLNLSALGKVGTVEVKLIGTVGDEEFTASTTMTVNPATAGEQIVKEAKNYTYEAKGGADNADVVTSTDEDGWVSFKALGGGAGRFNVGSVWSDYNESSNPNGPFLQTYCVELGAKVDFGNAMPKLGLRVQRMYKNRTTESSQATQSSTASAKRTLLTNEGYTELPMGEFDLKMRIFTIRTVESETSYKDVYRVYYYIDDVCKGYQDFNSDSPLSNQKGYMQMTFTNDWTRAETPFPIKVKTLTYNKFSVLDTPTVSVAADNKTVTVDLGAGIADANKIVLQTNDGTEVEVDDRYSDEDGVTLVAAEVLPADVKVVLTNGVKEADKDVVLWTGDKDNTTPYSKTATATRKGETLSGAMSINLDNTVADLAVTDLQVYQSGQSAIVKTTVNANGAATVGKLLIVGYKGTDTPSMTECKIVDATASAAGLEDNIYTVQLDKSFDYVRVFFWSDLIGITPLYTTQSTL